MLAVSGCTRCGRETETVLDTAKRDSANNISQVIPGEAPAAQDSVADGTAAYRDNSTNRAPTLHQDSAEITNLRLLTRKQKVIYEAALLVGKWTRGTENEVYLSDGTGRMWDSSEDVSASEAQSFNWTLDSNLLTIICHLELGGVLPKRYVVTFADDESLVYRDNYGTFYMWDKKK